ncbi:hypothetical protein TNCV_2382121 [Trichonephila clavipes]|nr:hypothetical protein TNCV_2382121 [Trichonephila clavipes]
MEAITGLYRYHRHTTPLPVIRRIGERTISYLRRAWEQLRHFMCDGFVGCVIVCDSLVGCIIVCDGLIAFAVDRWSHDCCGSFSRPGSPMKKD